RVSVVEIFSNMLQLCVLLSGHCICLNIGVVSLLLKKLFKTSTHLVGDAGIDDATDIQLLSTSDNSVFPPVSIAQSINVFNVILLLITLVLKDIAQPKVF